MDFKKLIKKTLLIFVAIAFLASQALSNPPVPGAKTKFYNFDDLLINGKVKKPQVLWIDKRQKVKFERLLKLKRDFLENLRDTRKDPILR